MRQLQINMLLRRRLLLRRLLLRNNQAGALGPAARSTATHPTHPHHFKPPPSNSAQPHLCVPLLSSPQVWEGAGVVKSARKLIGATNPLEAEPGTIRGDLAVQARCRQPAWLFRFGSGLWWHLSLCTSSVHGFALVGELQGCLCSMVGLPALRLVPACVACLSD